MPRSNTPRADARPHVALANNGAPIVDADPTSEAATALAAVADRLLARSRQEHGCSSRRARATVFERVP
jgi:Flp pilus assembly CpaE family ATPase